MVVGVIAFFFSRLAANRGGSKKNSYQGAEMGNSGFMFVDSGSGYSSEDSNDDEGDDSEGDDGYDFTDNGGSYDGGGDSYDGGGGSSSSSSE